MATDVTEDLPVTEWDARAELAVGLFIRRYLATNPPPEDAKFAIDFYVWGEKMVSAAHTDLADRDHAEKVVLP